MFFIYLNFRIQIQNIAFRGCVRPTSFMLVYHSFHILSSSLNTISIRAKGRPSPCWPRTWRRRPCRSRWCGRWCWGNTSNKPHCTERSPMETWIDKPGPRVRPDVDDGCNWWNPRPNRHCCPNGRDCGHGSSRPNHLEPQIPCVDPLDCGWLRVDHFGPEPQLCSPCGRERRTGCWVW